MKHQMIMRLLRFAIMSFARTPTICVRRRVAPQIHHVALARGNRQHLPRAPLRRVRFVAGQVDEEGLDQRTLGGGLWRHGSDAAPTGVGGAKEPRHRSMRPGILAGRRAGQWRWWFISRCSDDMHKIDSSLVLPLIHLPPSARRSLLESKKLYIGSCLQCPKT